MLDRVMDRFQLQDQSFKEVEDSHSSTVYKCTDDRGETVYLKIPYNKIKYQRELEAYHILKGKVAIPDMLDYWSGDEECPGAFLLSELKGSPLTTDASPKVAYDVGVLHASMHNIQPPDKFVLTGMKNEFPNWTTFVENQFYGFAEDVEGVLDPLIFNLALNTFEKMKRQLPKADGPSFIHMDFRPANVIVDGNKISGVIDFESVRFGSTEIDFTKLYRDFLRFDAAFYQAYQEGYTSVRPITDFDAILPFYRFTDAFNSIGWCKRRGIEKNASFFEENLELLKEFLQ